MHIFKLRLYNSMEPSIVILTGNSTFMIMIQVRIFLKSDKMVLKNKQVYGQY